MNQVLGETMAPAPALADDLCASGPWEISGRSGSAGRAVEWLPPEQNSEWERQCDVSRKE